MEQSDRVEGINEVSVEESSVAMQTDNKMDKNTDIRKPHDSEVGEREEVVDGTNWTYAADEQSRPSESADEESANAQSEHAENRTMNASEQIVVREKSHKMLFRNPSDKLIGGVCGGIADYLGVDPTLVRIAWVVLTLITAGGGVPAYLALWILLPVGTTVGGQQQPAAVALNEQSLSRVAFLLIGLGTLWFLSNIGILPWAWDLFDGLFSIVFWPALLIGAGYLVLRYTGKGFNWNASDTADRVKNEVDNRMPTSDDMKSGVDNVRQSFPLKRSNTDRVFMGVCGGIGQKLGIDANLVRLIWAAFSIGSIGMGVLVYVLVGLFLPEEKDTDLMVNDDEAQEVTIVDATSN